MVGRLHFAGRCHRTRTRVPHFGPCVRDDSAASAKGSRRNTSANERRKSPPILHPESRSLCGAILCATGFPHIETFHSEALSVNFEYILPAFGGKRLCDISTVEVQRFILQKFNNGLGWETCNHLRNLLSKIFACAKKWGHFGGGSPASGVELPEKRPAREKRVLMPKQVALLLSHLQEPVRTMVMLAVLTGLRVGEILGLRWQDLDLERGELRVEQAVYRGSLGTPKTKGSKRTLPLPHALVLALQTTAENPGAPKGQELVFQTRKGTAFSDTNLLLRQIKPAARKIGLPWVSWHSFRRTHATLLQLAGGSAKDAQAQLGHAQITTTLGIYTLPVPAHQRESVEKLSRLVTNGDEFEAGSGAGLTQSELLQ